MKGKRLKRTMIGIAVIIGILVCVIIAALAVLHVRTGAILDDYSAVYGNEKYQTPVMVEDVEVIKQDVSCGYAVIEMFSAWNGDTITEESLYDQYGKVVTSTGKAFCDEMNRQFPEYSITMHKYLKNTEMIDLIYETLSRGIPVPFEWAAQSDHEWTLHYSLITGMNIPADRITVANPYGYDEEITVTEFLNRTSFEAYEKMPLFMKLGFAFGVFEKNTVFEAEKNR